MKNQVVELLEKRLASRSFAADAIPKEIVDEIAEAARLTPSCYNKQPWRFMFLESPEALAKSNVFLVPGNAVWAGRAKLVVIGYSKAEDDCQLPDGREYHEFDLGLCVMNMILAATARGLVARPMAGFDPQKVREIFGLSETEKPLITVAFGYKSEDEAHLPDYYKGADSRPRERKPVSEIVKKL